MKIAFISLSMSSNDPRRCKMLSLSILVRDDGGFLEFTSKIKPVPALTKAERELLPYNYATLRTAPPLCDLVPDIAEILEQAQTVFLDRLSEKIFKKAFREIGYPIGSATFVLEKIFRETLKIRSSFSLEYALEFLGHPQPILTEKEKCRAMETLFNQLVELTSSSPSIHNSSIRASSRKNDLDLRSLPKHPGIYLFRNAQGEIIYVGKAKDISKRVRSHFSSSLPFEINLCQETVSVEYEETGSETIALLLESHHIDGLKPRFNTQQKVGKDPFIIVSKIDSKGVLRIGAVQKSYTDSVNEFYYNRDSVLCKLRQVQERFHLCKRYAGIERSSGKCSDPVFCRGICRDAEKKEEYNLRARAALLFIEEQRPSFLLKLRGRTAFETGFVLVKKGIYCGFGFIDAECQINSLADVETYTKPFSHTYYTSRIIDQYFKIHGRSSENIIPIDNLVNSWDKN